MQVVKLIQANPAALDDQSGDTWLRWIQTIVPDTVYQESLRVPRYNMCTVLNNSHPIRYLILCNLSSFCSQSLFHVMRFPLTHFAAYHILGRQSVQPVVMQVKPQYIIIKLSLCKSLQYPDSLEANKRLIIIQKRRVFCVLQNITLIPRTVPSVCCSVIP